MNSAYYLSSANFESSSDILEYLRSHPDFQRLPKSLLDVIIAGILSGLIAIVGGVLIILSAGAATPGVIAAEQSVLVAFLLPSVLVSVGAAGLQYCIANGRDFQWSQFAKECALAGGLTVLTFGAGYGAGSLAGVALVGKVSLSAFNLKVIQCAAGALAGSGVRVGSRIVISSIDGKPLCVTELVLEGVVGAVEGGFAGFLAAKKFSVRHIHALDEAQKAQLVGPANAAAGPVPPGPRPAVHMPDHQVLEVVDDVLLPADLQPVGRNAAQLPRDSLTIAIGYQIEGAPIAVHGAGGAAGAPGLGLQHMLARHPDMAGLLGHPEVTQSLVAAAARNGNVVPNAAISAIPTDTLTAMARRIAVIARTSSRYAVQLPHAQAGLANTNIFFAVLDQHANDVFLQIAVSNGISQNAAAHQLITSFMVQQLPANVKWVDRAAVAAIRASGMGRREIAAALRNLLV